MSTRKTPDELKRFIQSNVGDYGGNLWSTFNCDLDSNPGVIKTAPRLTQVLGTDEIGSERVLALQLHDGEYYVATQDDVYDCSVNSDPTDASNWSDTTTLGSEDLGLETDMTSFDGLLLISLGTDIMSWDGSSKNNDYWTTLSGTPSALTANFTHTMDVLRSGTDTLFVTDKNKIRYFNGTAGGTIITIDPLMVVHCMTPSLDRMWVGSYTEVENNAYVYEVQIGATNTLGDPSYNQSYAIEGRVCLTMFTYRNTPFVITDQGYIQAFNGAGFVTVAQFPWAGQSQIMKGCQPGQVQDSSTSRAIHPKGAQVSGKYCYIYVNTENEANVANNLDSRSPSGVWVLDLETYSLTHKYALTDTTADYGSHKVNFSGPLLITNTPETRLMVGGDVETEGLWMEGTATPQAYFTLVRHESESVADAFEAFAIKNDTLASDETVTVKYKDLTLPGFPLLVNTITWLNATQFTTLDPLTDVLGESAAGEQDGYEIEFLSGLGAGQLAHIVSITGTTTKTVTVDASFGVLNSTSDIQIDSYKLLKVKAEQADGEVKKLGSGGTSPSRQYKVVMKGDVTVRETISKSNNNNSL